MTQPRVVKLVSRKGSIFRRRVRDMQGRAGLLCAVTTFLPSAVTPLTLKVLLGFLTIWARRGGQSKRIYEEALAKCRWHIPLPRISSSLSSANKAALHQLDQNVPRTLRKSLTVHGDSRI